MTSIRQLDVYLYEQKAGRLIQDSSGSLSFVYDSDYLNSSNSQAISVSMPLSEKVYTDSTARPYFSGILPDDAVRHRLAHFLGVSEKNPFSLLEAIGGECAGALSLIPEGMYLPNSNEDELEILDDIRLGEILDLLKNRPLLAGGDNIRLSLAGAQDKMAVAVRDDKICLIHGMTPTTHILKPLISHVTDSVHNEVFCMQLAKRMKIDVPEAEIRWLGHTPYFLVERYDRLKTPEGVVKRVHQEDFCQAVSIMPEMKYEREGGPSILKSLALLDTFSERPAVDQLSFLKRIIFNYLIGNSDAHGKNFSLLYHSKTPRLSPAYDLLSTCIYPNLTSNMAMKIGNKYDPENVFLRHWHALIPNTKTSQQNFDKLLFSCAESVVIQAQELIIDFQDQGIVSPLFRIITDLIQKRSKQITNLFI